jgi:uncharacterized protein (DUF488 family)
MNDLPALYTIGYEKRSIDDLLWVLQARGVDRVVDVRLKPWSRRPGFSKTKLAASLAAAGIDYLHAGGLGNPPDIRALYLAGKPEEGHRAFRRHLSNGADAALEELIASIGHKRIALLCLERDARVCHRSVVAHVVAERGGGERAVIDL